MSEQHTLYRFKDQQGRLLYVGITNDPSARMKQHRADKSWWSEVATMEMEHYPSRVELAAAEREAIQTELPYWNTMHDATTLDEQLGILFGALPLEWSSITLLIPETVTKDELFQIDQIISAHRGGIPIKIEVLHSDRSRSQYVTDRTTSTNALPQLREALGWLGANPE